MSPFADRVADALQTIRIPRTDTIGLFNLSAEVAREIAPRVAAAIDRVATEYAQEVENEHGIGHVPDGDEYQRILTDMRVAALRVLRGDAP